MDDDKSFLRAILSDPHDAALRLRPEQRFLPRLVPWLGLAGCAGLVVSLSLVAITIAAGVLATLVAARHFLRPPHEER